MLEKRRTNWINRLFPISSWVYRKKKILDIGIGVGDLTEDIAKRAVGKVRGIDIVDFRRKGIRQQSSFEFNICDATKLEFDDNSFDCVLIFWTLHHIPNFRKALQEASRVLSSSGELIIIEDILNIPKGFKYFFLRLYDRIINLDIDKHPHNNLSFSGWKKEFSSLVGLSLIESEITRPSSIFSFLCFGYFRLRKL